MSYQCRICLEEDDKQNNTGTISLQNKFGEYDKNENIITSEKLKQIGKDLLLKSSGFKEDLTKGSSLATFGTGFNKVDISDTRAKNAEGFPTFEATTGEEVSVRTGRGDIVEIDPSAVNSKTFEVKALFNFSPRTSISKSLIRIFLSLDSNALFNIAISCCKISI